MGSFTQLTYHIVFSTKYRRPLISQDVRENLFEYIGGIIRAKSGVLTEIGGAEDHVHILARLSPKFAVSDIVRDVKAGSSKWMNERRKAAVVFEWQKGYGAFTVSCSQISTVCRYIQNQPEHHRKVSFADEYAAFLKRHGITFRPEHLFEDEHHG